MSWQVIEGDCVEAMRQMDEASVDAIVTDPPYGLEFMGKEWDNLEVKSYEDGVAQKIKEMSEGRFWADREPADHKRPENKGQTASPYLSARVNRYEAGARAQEWHQAWATEALRVLKPGGHLLAFGGTRTYHRLACAVEDAGFEIRDSLIWMYGSGFPKSLDVSKAIDKAAGAEREVTGKGENWGASKIEDGKTGYGDYAGEWNTTAPATPDAAQWEGWGTALKPAHEPIVVARKPLVGTVSRNVLEHGTGALNIDGCRIGTEQRTERPTDFSPMHGNRFGDPTVTEHREAMEARTYEGRWPANVVLSHLPECEQVGTRRVKGGNDPTGADGSVRRGGIFGDGVTSPGRYQGYADPDGTETITAWECAPGCPIAELDEQSGERGGSGKASGPSLTGESTSVARGQFNGVDDTPFYGDTGGASRFYYTAKASRGERNAGLDGLPEIRKGSNFGNDGPRPHTADDYQYEASTRNTHPTVKPIDLMRWLVRLVTPHSGLSGAAATGKPGKADRGGPAESKRGIVLDPFTGSGTTGIAAVLEGFDFIGIEREPEYVEIARARITFWAQHEGRDTAEVLRVAGSSERIRKEHEERGQLGLDAA